MKSLIGDYTVNHIVANKNRSVKANAAVNSAHCIKAQITVIGDTGYNETDLVHMRIYTDDFVRNIFALFPRDNRAEVVHLVFAVILDFIDNIISDSFFIARCAVKQA